MIGLDIRQDSCVQPPCLTKKSAPIRHSAALKTDSGNFMSQNPSAFSMNPRRNVVHFPQSQKTVQTGKEREQAEPCFSLCPCQHRRAGHQAAGICTGAGVSARKPAARRPELPRPLKDIRSGKGGLARLYKAGPLVPQYRGVLQTEDTQSKLADHPGRLRRRNRFRRLKVIVNAAAEDRFSAVFFLPVRK